MGSLCGMSTSRPSHCNTVPSWSTALAGTVKFWNTRHAKGNSGLLACSLFLTGIGEQCGVWGFTEALRLLLRCSLLGSSWRGASSRQWQGEWKPSRIVANRGIHSSKFGPSRGGCEKARISHQLLSCCFQRFQITWTCGGKTS